MSWVQITFLGMHFAACMYAFLFEPVRNMWARRWIVYSETGVWSGCNGWDGGCNVRRIMNYYDYRIQKRMASDKDLDVWGKVVLTRDKRDLIPLRLKGVQLRFKPGVTYETL